MTATSYTTTSAQHQHHNTAPEASTDPTSLRESQRMDSDQETVIFDNKDKRRWQQHSHQRGIPPSPTTRPSPVPPPPNYPLPSHVPYNHCIPPSPVPPPSVPTLVPPLHSVPHSSSSSHSPSLPLPHQYSFPQPRVPVHPSVQYSTTSPSEHHVPHTPSLCVPRNNSTTQNPHPHSRHSSTAHTSSRHHRRRHIIFLRPSTRYSKMRLHISSLNLSTNGFLDSLRCNKTRLLKSCWEREIIPNVPRSQRPVENDVTKDLVCGVQEEEDGRHNRSGNGQDWFDATPETPTTTCPPLDTHTHPTQPTQPSHYPQQGSPDRKNSPQTPTSSRESRINAFLSQKTGTRYTPVSQCSVGFLMSMLRSSTSGFIEPIPPQDTSREVSPAPRKAPTPPKPTTAPTDDTVRPTLLCLPQDNNRHQAEDQEHVLAFGKTSTSSQHPYHATPQPHPSPPPERSPEPTRKKETMSKKVMQELENCVDHRRKDKKDTSEEKKKSKEANSTPVIADERQKKDKRIDENQNVKDGRRAPKEKNEDSGKKGHKESEKSQATKSPQKKVTREESSKQTQSEGGSKTGKYGKQRAQEKSDTSRVKSGERIASKVDESKNRKQTEKRSEESTKRGRGTEREDNQNYRREVKEREDKQKRDKEKEKNENLNHRKTVKERENNHKKDKEKEKKENQNHRQVAKKKEDREKRDERENMEKNREHRKTEKRKREDRQIGDKEEARGENRNRRKIETKSRFRQKEDERRKAEERGDSRKRRRLSDEKKVSLRPSPKRYKSKDVRDSSTSEKNTHISLHYRTGEGENHNDSLHHKTTGIRRENWCHSLHHHRTGDEESADPSLQHHRIPGVRDSNANASLHQYGTTSGTEENTNISLHHKSTGNEGRDTTHSLHKAVSEEKTNTPVQYHRTTGCEESKAHSLHHQTAAAREENNPLTSPHHKSRNVCSHSSLSEENNTSPHHESNITSEYSALDEENGITFLHLSHKTNPDYSSDGESSTYSLQLFPDESSRHPASPPPSESHFSTFSPTSSTAGKVVVKEEPPALPSIPSEASGHAQSSIPTITILTRNIVVKEEPPVPHDTAPGVNQECPKATAVAVKVKKEPEEHQDTGGSLSWDGGQQLSLTIKTEPAEYVEMMKTETFLEEDSGTSKKVRQLMDETLYTLGLEEGQGIPELWDGSTAESLYDHLKSCLVAMECSVWEAPTASFAFTWEVNLRRLAVASLAQDYLEHFTRDIYRHMKEQPSYKVFVTSLMQESLSRKAV